MNKVKKLVCKSLGLLKEFAGLLLATKEMLFNPPAQGEENA